jgi:hypothetical protein
MKRRLKIRHREMRKGDYRIVINYVAKTKAIIDAALFRGNELITTTDDVSVIYKWIETAT